MLATLELKGFQMRKAIIAAAIAIYFLSISAIAQVKPNLKKHMATANRQFSAPDKHLSGPKGDRVEITRTENPR